MSSELKIFNGNVATPTTLLIELRKTLMSASKILFISGSMPLGGGSTSILNLCDGLRRDGTWEPHVAVFESQDTVGEQIHQRGHSVHGPCLGIIHEDRIAQMLGICRKAKEVLATTKTMVSYQPYGVPMPEAPTVPDRANPLRVLYLGRLYEEQKRVA